MKKPENVPGDTPLERMAAFAKELIAVPREEIVKREREYQAQRQRAKRKRSK